MQRKLEVYVKHYGPTAGPTLYRAHQSQAAHAGVSQRLRRKVGELSRAEARAGRSEAHAYPLFAGVTGES